MKLTLHCDNRCGVTLTVPKADLDKMPATWICPACVQRDIDNAVADMEQEWTRADQ